ncbi:MAG: hypothetical protein AAF663_07825 [Planctomycetota bacterium]
MADADPRKPDPIDPPEDDGLYELAEDPDVSEPSPAAPPPPGIGRPSPLDNDRLDPMLDDPATPPEPDREMKTGSGGKGAASHFSGDDPDYVNPEIARMRREEARIKAAEEEAEADAKKKKLILLIAVVSALVGVVAYALLF